MKNTTAKLSNLAEAVSLAQKFGSVEINYEAELANVIANSKFRPGKKDKSNEKLRQLENVGFGVTN